jgi:N-acetylmuramoyl-L-alanine amidase
LRILIDCGHGDGNNGDGLYDPGAVSQWGKEHEIVATLASQLKEKAKVPVLRAPEVSRAEVAKWANWVYQPGDIFLSLHMNAGGPSATGVEVIVAATAATERFEQAKGIATALSAHLGLRNRGVLADIMTDNGRKKGLTVLRKTKMPAFLLELGFVTNKNDVALVLERGADAILAAIDTL